MSGAYIGNIQITIDDLDLLEKLTEVDGRNGHVFIYDEALRNALIAHGYAKINEMKYVWGTSSLASLLLQLKQILGGE